MTENTTTTRTLYTWTEADAQAEAARREAKGYCPNLRCIRSTHTGNHTNHHGTEFPRTAAER